jgi:hypothetical protein
MILTPEITQRIYAVKQLFRLATTQSQSNSAASRIASLTLLHDCIERFLLCCITATNESIGEKAEFSNYISILDKHFPKKVIPHRNELIALNKARVQSKHYGNVVDQDSLRRYVVTTNSFLQKSCQVIFSKTLESINYAIHIERVNTKSYVEKAIVEYENGDYEQAIISMRKAFFLVFEQQFDIRHSKDSVVNPLLSPLSLAPPHCQTAGWIMNNVKDPFDYIQIDRSYAESMCIRLGINPSEFENIRDITDDVYQYSNGKWIVREKLRPYDADEIKATCEYVIDTVVNFIWLEQNDIKRKAFQSQQKKAPIYIKRDSKVYGRASTQSRIIFTVPSDALSVTPIYKTPGIDDNDKFYYRVIFFYGLSIQSQYCDGYVLEEDAFEASTNIT